MSICTFMPMPLDAQTALGNEEFDTEGIKQLFARASQLRYIDPDSALALSNLCEDFSRQHQDTAMLIRALSQQATIFGHQANYKKAYDRLWDALLHADKANLEQDKVTLYRSLGRYYSFLKREKEAIEYFDRALALNRSLIARGLVGQPALANDYYQYTATYRELDKPELGRIYLDSSFMYHEEGVGVINKTYLDFESAYVLYREGRYQEALDLFDSVVPWLQDKNPGYQVLLFTYIGDVLRSMERYKLGENHYQQALEYSERYKSHRDFTPLIHERLATMYRSLGRHASAYENLSKAKELDEEYFDARSENNRPLLEVLDAFHRTKEEQQQFVQEQKMRALEQEERVLFLQRTLLLIGIGAIMLLGYVYLKYLRSRHRTEKKLIQQQKELELQKANEILDLKNRELSTSTLKLIEKDEFIANLKTKLSSGDGAVNVNEIKRILHTMSAGNDQNWEEFEARFISVNKGFYERLKQKYPKLTQGDLRLSALIKLNFSSKDMARLLGISVESVHTTRYRLRKKLGLTRDVNLAEFIARI